MNIDLLPDGIRGCTAMLHQKARYTSERLPREHRRWIDPEDVLQEGLLAAVRAQQKFDTGKRTKFSTYLFDILDNHFQNTFSTALTQQKRTGKLVELDAPPPDDAPQFQLRAVAVSAERQLAAVSAFVDAAVRLSPRAFAYCVGGFLCGRYSTQGNRYRDERQMQREIQNVFRKQNCTMDDVSVVCADAKQTRMALTQISSAVTLKSGTQMDAKILECRACHGQLPVSAIQLGRFNVDTMTCTSCLDELQESPLSCFGKVKTPEQDGYTEADAECRIHCRDRKPCLQHIGASKMKEATEITTAAEPNVDEIDFSDVETTKPKPKAKSKPNGEAKSAAPKKAAAKKAAAPAKSTPAKAAKATATKKAEPAEKKAAEKKPAAKAEPVVLPKRTDSLWFAPDQDPEPVPPDSIGNRWPCKKASVFRYVWQQAFHGCKVEDLEKVITGLGFNFKIARQFLRNQYSGVKRVTHKWVLDEQGGRLKIENVKCLIPFEAPK